MSTPYYTPGANQNQPGGYGAQSAGIMPPAYSNSYTPNTLPPGYQNTGQVMAMAPQPQYIAPQPLYIAPRPQYIAPPISSYQYQTPSSKSLPSYNCVLVETIIACLCFCPLLGCIGLICVCMSDGGENKDNLKTGHCLGISSIIIGLVLAAVGFVIYIFFWNSLYGHVV